MSLFDGTKTFVTTEGITNVDDDPERIAIISNCYYMGTDDRLILSTFTLVTPILHTDSALSIKLKVIAAVQLELGNLNANVVYL